MNENPTIETSPLLSSSNSIILSVIEEYFSKDQEEPALKNAIESLKDWAEKQNLLVENAQPEEKEEIKKIILMQIKATLKTYLFFKNKLPEINNIESVYAICNEALSVTTKLLDDEYIKSASIPLSIDDLAKKMEDNSSYLIYLIKDTFDLDESFVECIARWFCWEISSFDKKRRGALEDVIYVRSKKSAIHIGLFTESEDSIISSINIRFIQPYNQCSKTYNNFIQTLQNQGILFEIEKYYDDETACPLEIRATGKNGKNGIISAMGIIKNLGFLDKITYEKLNLRFYFVDPFQNIVNLISEEKYEQALETAISAEKSGFENYVLKLAQFLHDKHVYDKALNAYLSVKQNSPHYQKSIMRCMDILELALSDGNLASDQRIKYMEHQLELLTEISELGYHFYYHTSFPEDLEKYENSYVFIYNIHNLCVEYGCTYIYSTSAFPEDLKQYRDSYLLHDSKLYFINSDRDIMFIEIKDFAQFLNDARNLLGFGDREFQEGINSIQNNKNEFEELIILHGGHTHHDKSLHYIDFNRSPHKINIDDFQILRTKFKYLINLSDNEIAINRNDKDTGRGRFNCITGKICLSRDEFYDLIPSNSGHTHFDVSYKKQRDFIFHQLRGNKGLGAPCRFELNMETICELLTEIRALKQQLAISKGEKKEEKLYPKKKKLLALQPHRDYLLILKF